MKLLRPTAMLRAAACCVMTALCCALTVRAQDLVETAPVPDADMLPADASSLTRASNAAFAQPDSIDRAAHTLATYELADVERIARVYRADGMRWFYNRHTPELLGQSLDSTGVPLIKYEFGWHRNPVMTSQAALAFYNGYLDTGSDDYLKIFKTNVDWLVENHDDHYLRYGFPWRHGSRSLDSGWVSAMGQGEALAAVSSAYFLTGEQKYLDAATGFFETMYRNTEETWAFTVDDQGYYWLEEYPNRDTCHVLNGILFGLWGLWDYYVITDDSFALELFSAGIRTIADNYPIWNISDKDESLYCLHGLKYDFYHETHLRQFNDYLAYFDIPEFEEAVELFRLYPSIAGSHDTLDFGVVPVGNTLQRSLTIYNDGTDTLDISGVATGRSEFSVSTNDEVVAPGDSLSLTVAFAPVTEGIVSTTLRVTSNAPPLTVDLVGTAAAAALAADNDVLDFGDVFALAADTLSIHIRTPTADVIPIDSVTTGSRVFLVPAAKYSVEPDGWTAVPVIFAPMLSGTYAGDVVAHYGDDRLEVAVSGRAVSPLRITSTDGSAMLDFGIVLIGRPDTLRAVVENRGLVRVAVSEVYSPRADVEVLGGEMVVAGQDAQTFQVVIAPLEKGAVSDSLEVTTSVDRQPVRMAFRADVSTGVFVDEDAGIPETFGLDQNYPNPFGTTTHISYRLPEPSHVRLVVVNALGQVVRTVTDGYGSAGVHGLEIDLRDLPGGVYFCRMEAGGFTQTRRMVLF